MLSFFGEQCLKDAVVARVKEHQRLDQIIQQVYWDGSKGCAIGCVLHSSDHMAFQRQLGLPVFLAYMDEHIFESLPTDEAKQWPLRFIEAVPVGVDLEMVFPRFMHWLLTDSEGIRCHANTETVAIIDRLVELYARRLTGAPFDEAAAEAAEAEARAVGWAAAAAARVAPRVAEAVAARAAAWAAEAACAKQARAAPRAAAAAARLAAAEAAEVAVAEEVAEAAMLAAAAEVEAAAAARAAARAAASKRTYVNRQADHLISLLQSYESVPLSTQPCPDKIAALLPMESGRA